MTMEDFTNVDSPVWNNVAYEDTETQRQITQRVHQEMVDEGAVVTVPESTREQVGQSYPDLRDMKKAERTPILRQKMKELKGALRQFLNGLKGGTYEFEVNGNILEARLYDTGVREVLEKIDQSKASMLYHSDQVFQNARYLYSTPDYDGDPNIYRWNYFYTPVRIGDETVGVRIAVRDLVETRNGRPESQIYNWGIKTGATLDGGRPSTKPPSSGVSSAAPEGATLDGGSRGPKVASSGVSSAAPEGATLDGGERGNMPDRSGVSSVVPSISSIPQTGGENNTNAVRDGGLTLPTAVSREPALLPTAGTRPETLPVLEQEQAGEGAGSAGPVEETGGAVLTAEDVSWILSQIEQASTEQGQNSTAASTGEAGGYTQQEANRIRHEGETFRNLAAGVDTTLSRMAQEMADDALVAEELDTRQDELSGRLEETFGENGQKAFRTLRAEGMEADAYEDFARAYNAGRNGTGMARSTTGRVLDAAGMRSAYYAGQNDSTASRAKGAENAGLTRDANLKKAGLSTRDERRLDALGKALGVQIQFETRIDDGAGHEANAKYENGTISLSLDAEDPVFTSVIHEAVHRIREADPDSYSALAVCTAKHERRGHGLFPGQPERAVRHGQPGLPDGGGCGRRLRQTGKQREPG